MKRYPWLEGTVRHGRYIAAGCGLALAIGAAAAFSRTGSAALLVLGLGAAAGLYAVLRIAVDVLDLVADTLLPK